MILLLGAFSMNAAAEELADVYVATTGLDTNTGTEEAPVLSLDKALELVQDGGTVHIVDSYTAAAGFVWNNHNKDVTITGGTLDLSLGYTEATEGDVTIQCYYQGDAVTYDNLQLVLADGAYYFANGFRLQVNENVTVDCENIQLFGGGHRKAVASTNVKLLGGDYLCSGDGYGSIYGGGYKANVTGDVNLYVGNINSQYTTSHDGKTRLYGGGYSCNVSGDINLTVTGANVDRISGVSHNACTVSGNVNVLMSGGNAYSLYGGGSGCTIAGDIDLTVTGGTIAQVFGANEGTGYQGNVTVMLKGGTITRRFFGGCYNNYEILSGYTGDYHVTGNIDVCVYEGMNFVWNTSESDYGFFAHSRYSPLFDEEVSNLYYIGAASQTKHAENLAQRNSGMNMVMGSSTAIADNTAVISMTTQAKEWNIVLGDDIGANFYFDLPKTVADMSVLKVTVDGETESHDLSQQNPDAEGLYLIPVDVAAAQMTEAITLQLVIDGVDCEAVTYTVREYADTILTGTYVDEIKALVKHMLNYGANAQVYFDVNTDDLANAGYALEEVQIPALDPELAVNNGISGIRFYGASLIMNSQITVRYYFTADSVEGVTFTANGKNYTAGHTNNMFYVDVPGINPHEYSNSIVLSAVKGEETLEVTYSPMTYIVRMSKKGSDAMKALVKAMYGYHEAAVAYVNQCGATVKLPDVTGGTVTTNQNVYQSGQTVTITATPDEGYNLTALTVTKDGQSVDIGEVAFAGGEYSFVAELGSYSVDATFTEKVFQDTDSFDLTNQYNGVVAVKTGSTSAQTVTTYADTYRDAAVTIRDQMPDATTFGAELHFNFTNGNAYMIRVEKKDGAYRIQNMDPDIVSSWPTVYWFNDAQTAKLQSEEGIEYRVTIAGTQSFIYLDGVCVATQDLSAGITTENAQVALVVYGNEGVENVEIPVMLNSEPIAATVTVSATNGTVEADKDAYIAGETVTLTVTPDKYYNLTALTVKKDGEVVKTFETTLEGGTYTFATTAEGTYTVEATFVRDTVIAAYDTGYILRSTSVNYADGNTYVARGDTTGLYADDPRIDTLLDVAPGKFNASGNVWPWIAYKISVPAEGTYTLGVTTESAKFTNYKMPMVVNHEVYTLAFTAKAQTAAADVTLPAGEYIVTVFWPMPADESEVNAADWNSYQWANIASVSVDYALTASLPTAAEVETYMVPNKIVAAIDDSTVLWSAAIGNASGKFLEFNSRDAVKADMPYIESLHDDAPGEFNKSGEEWGWFAYKVTAPADGVYTLQLQMQSCRNAPYYMPLYVNEEVYALYYGATGAQSAYVNVSLTEGEHTVVIFMPMPKSAQSANGTDYVDYPWANPQTLVVDGLLSVSKPTVEEVEACFVPDQVISAVDATQILHSATIEVADTYLGRTDQETLGADLPTIENLYTNALGQFNASGEEWNWFAYKVSVPAQGTYTLGVKTSGSKYASYKLPLCVDGNLYTLEYTAKAQLVTVDVTLPAGEHTVVMFMPIPAAEANIAGNVWNDYHWCNVESVTVDPKLTVSLPTVEEVEAAVVADHTISTIDDTTVLWSAAMGNASGTFLEFNSRDAVKADMPYIDSLHEDAIGQFNKAGEEWGWFAYKVTAPADGTYTLALQVQACKNAPYYIPVYINEELYALSYATTGTETASMFVTLPAGEYTVVMFMPMPKNAEGITGEDWKDYPWCNPQTLTVDAQLTVSKPTVEEVEACFPPDVVISAVDATQILHSATIEVTDTYLGRTDQSTLGTDLPTIENLYIDACGQFNVSGQEWNWFAYKVTAPADGTYTLGVQTSGSKYTSYMLPLCVNGEVYALQYTTKAQLVTAEVTLPAGEHTVVMFMPMPATSANIAGNVWNDYHWCNVESVTVDPKLTVSLPTVEEVEAVFALETFAAADTSYVLRSAAVKYVEGNGYVERGSTTGVYEDTPRIDTLLELAPGNFNESGKEWIWIAYKISIPVDGTYTLGVTTNSAKYNSFKIPMVVNQEVHTLTFSAKAQTVTAEVTLPAGEHVVTVFWPMPADESNVDASNANNYIWVNIANVTVDYSLTISAPTAEEVEACFPVVEVTEEETTEEGVTVEETTADEGEYSAFF